jgi:hypothetical protein
MKNAIFWDVMMCGFYKKQCSSETSVLTRTTWRNILGDCILLIDRFEDIKSEIPENVFWD